MRYVTLVIWFCANVFVLFHVCGCSDFQLVGDSLQYISGDAAAPNQQDAAPMSRPPPAPLDAGLEPVDAPVIDAVITPSDVMMVSDTAPMTDAASLMTPSYTSRVLSPTTCHGRTLHLPDNFFQTGLTAWHFCYVTSEPTDRDDGGPAPIRPASVSFQVGPHDTISPLVPMVSATAPLVANPWTASVAVALPTTVSVPRFNVRQDPPAGFTGMQWALDTDGHGGLREHGFLRVWRVAADGQQMEVPLGELFLTCNGAHVLSDMPCGNYVPMGLCPNPIMTCQPGPHLCQ